MIYSLSQVIYLTSDICLQKENHIHAREKAFFFQKIQKVKEKYRTEFFIHFLLRLQALKVVNYN